MDKVLPLELRRLQRYNLFWNSHLPARPFPESTGLLAELLKISVIFQHYANADCPQTARHALFLSEWAKQYEVSLIAASTNRENRITHDHPWVGEGVTLHEIPIAYDNAMTTWQRLKSFTRFMRHGLRKAIQLPPPDVFVGISTPLTTAVTTALAAKWHGRPWVFEVKDLWPDFPIQMGAVPWKPAQHALYALERWLYQDAAHVIATSPDMAAHVRTFLPAHKVTLLSNGTDLDVIASLRDDEVKAMRDLAQCKPGQTLVVYAGSLGRANHVELLKRVAHMLADRQDVVFAITGRGFHRPELEALSERIPNLKLLPVLARRQSLALFKAANLSLVAFLPIPVLGANSPAKFYDSLACGTPVLVVNPGWTRSFVEEEGCGWFVSGEEPDAVARQVHSLMANPETLRAASLNALRVARENTHGYFNREPLHYQYAQILEQVARRQPVTATDEVAFQTG